MNKVAVVIPARWGATRFPGKPLALIAGKPLIQRVVDQCRLARGVDRVVVATDDERIFRAVEKMSVEVRMTASDHPSGTDRVAEVARGMKDCQGIINVQGDEPLIDPSLIARMARRLAGANSPEMLSAGLPLSNPEAGQDPNVVKVVLDGQGRALYFSRSLIPFSAGAPLTPWRHLGIYGYTRRFLLRFVRWKPVPLELCEKLEQLRALHHGVHPEILRAGKESLGVDCPDDVERVEQVLAST